MHNRVIMHIDLDAFFASCEEVAQPWLKGKPVIIGADPKNGKGRGVVSTANYEARKYGIHSAMPISRAYSKCKHGIFLRGSWRLYRAISGRIFTHIASLGYPFEQTGVDEAYIDLSGCTFHEAERIGRQIQAFTETQERVTCSVGIGPNKLIAKIGSDFKKPNGITVIRPEEAQSFLSDLPIQKIPGIGPKTTVKLNKRGVQYVRDLLAMPETVLRQRFGRSYGNWLFRVSRGIDKRRIGVFRERKSIGAERTFMMDVEDEETVHERIEELIKKIYTKMSNESFSSKTLVLKVRYEDFETHTVQKTAFHLLTHGEAVAVAMSLLRPFLRAEKKIRLVGVRFTGLESTTPARGQLLLGKV